MILRALADGTQLSAEQIADIAGIHVNTARFHLKRLVEDGVAVETTVPTGARGRPQVFYRARLQSTGKRSYLMLAEMLSDIAATADPGPISDVGHAWGRRIAEGLDGPPPADPPDVDTVAVQVEAVMDSIGFQPLLTVRGSAQEPEIDVKLRHCPFLEVASRHPGLICGMHRSLLQGVLDGLGSGLHVERLDAFVTPDTCRAELRR